MKITEKTIVKPEVIIPAVTETTVTLELTKAECDIMFGALGSSGVKQVYDFLIRKKLLDQNTTPHDYGQFDNDVVRLFGKMDDFYGNKLKVD